MSDDLISRKAIYKAISDYLNRSRLGETSAQTDLRVGEIASIIHGVPTAFNKEKVIEELISEASRWHESGVEFKDENEKGVAAGFRLATHIVERGGIE